MNIRINAAAFEKVFNLERVTNKQKHQIEMFVKYLRFLAVITSVFLIVLFIKNQTLNTKFMQRKLILQRNTLNEENRRLTIKYAAVTDPVRIEKIARKKMNMIVPKRSSIRLIQIYKEESEVNLKLASK